LNPATQHQTIVHPQKALATVFGVVLVDLLGFGLVLPLLPFYAGAFNATAVEIGLLYSVYSFSQLIFSPIWGSLSDRVGRRPIMLLSTLGGLLAYVWFASATSLLVLFLSRTLAGIMGGNIGAAQAYIADITPPEKRASGMALIGAAFGIGFVLGPAISAGILQPGLATYFLQLGWPTIASLLTEYSFQLIGYTAALMSLISFLMVVFFLPETVDTKDPKRLQVPSRPSPLSPTFWRNIISAEGVDHPRMFRLLLLSGFMLSFLQSTLYGAFPLFCEQVFNMTPSQVGVQFFYLGLITVLIQGFAIRFLNRYFQEGTLFFVGNILTVLSFLFIGFSGSVTLLTVWLSVMSVGMSLNGPTLSSLISKQVDVTRMGGMLGTYQSITGMGRVIGPTWGGFLFMFAVSLPFWLTSLMVLFTIYAAWEVMEHKPI